MTLLFEGAEWDFALMQRCITAQGGYINKYVGDEIVAVFGFPLAAEESAPRAVRAAEAMLRELAVLVAGKVILDEPCEPLQEDSVHAPGRDEGTTERYHRDICGHGPTIKQILVRRQIVSRGTRRGISIRGLQKYAWWFIRGTWKR